MDLKALMLSGALLILFCSRADARTYETPDTEQGNILLRKADMILFDAPFYLYLGHVGVLHGKPLGADSTGYFVNDMGSVAGTVNMQYRLFEDFQKTGWLGVIRYNSYSGGYTPFTPVGPLLVDIRQKIVDEAAKFYDDNLTWQRKFIKDEVNGLFRCDSLIEQIYENAGVTGGNENWKGLWPDREEPDIPNPKSYVHEGDSVRLQRI
ncbi:hypothetical protein ACFL2T_07905 [Elusimicrobiota bacterium]